MHLLEHSRRFLATHLFTSIHGMRLDVWLRQLKRQCFAVDPPYWFRALFITKMSLLTSIISRFEDRCYGARVRTVHVQQPIFILGHWRSGTTHLHNLLALDPQFAYPTLFQTLYPHTFLTSEGPSQVFRGLIPTTRLVDNIQFGFNRPQEDEFALCNATLLSPYAGWAFPRDRTYYDRYLTLREVSPTEVEVWKEAFMLFLRKLTWKYDRPLILKSPPHTCRIKLLLELFPDARFVHICRDPYTVFQSTRHLNLFMLRATTLQKIEPADLDSAILDRYRTMYDLFFEEKKLIPQRQYHEVRFEALEEDPVGQSAQIYEQLGLGRFERIRIPLEHYLQAHSNYQKNQYPPLPPPLRHRIVQTWQRNFEAWAYDG